MSGGYELELRVAAALDRFELDVEETIRHRSTGLFGPSGAGKSSLLQVIAGLRRGARGRVRLGDEVWLDSELGIHLPPERRGVGYVPQDGLLFPHLDVRRNLLAGEARALRSGRHRAAPSDVCELLELGPLLDRAVGSLSGGERQRVALGRAICSGPRLLLLDEPLASLDLPLSRRLLPFLQRVREELDVPMILVSHDPTEVQALCDRILVLEAGRVIAGGATREVLTEPRVFELAGEEGFQNLLPCRVESAGGPTTGVRLGADGRGPRLIVTAPPGPPPEAGARLFVALPADEVLVASSRLEGISARNVLPARVTSIAVAGRRRLVTAALAGEGPEVTAQITDEACEALGLEARPPVFLIVKSAACKLLGGERD